MWLPFMLGQCGFYFILLSTCLEGCHSGIVAIAKLIVVMCKLFSRVDSEMFDKLIMLT